MSPPLLTIRLSSRRPQPVHHPDTGSKWWGGWVGIASCSMVKGGGGWEIWPPYTSFDALEGPCSTEPGRSQAGRHGTAGERCHGRDMRSRVTFGGAGARSCLDHPPESSRGHILFRGSVPRVSAVRAVDRHVFSCRPRGALVVVAGSASASPSPTIEDDEDAKRAP